MEVVTDKRYRVIALGHNAAGNRDRRQVQAPRVCRNQIADATSKTIQEVSRTGTVNLEWAEQLADDRATERNGGSTAADDDTHDADHRTGCNFCRLLRFRIFTHPYKNRIQHTCLADQADHNEDKQDKNDGT